MRANTQNVQQGPTVSKSNCGHEEFVSKSSFFFNPERLVPLNLESIVSETVASRLVEFVLVPGCYLRKFTCT